jgi:hypothetical protein
MNDDFKPLNNLGLIQSEGRLAPEIIYALADLFAGSISNSRSLRERLNRLLKNSKSVIPRARFARGICFFLGIGEKADPSLRSG